MKNTVIVLTALLLVVSNISAQEVEINGNKFVVDGRDIWFTGINTPWNLFDDFGDPNFNFGWWSDEFRRYKQNNINLARVWIHGSGQVSPNISSSGYVSGASDLFWQHMDHLMSEALENKVYVMPALLSFDITRNIYSGHQAWRAFIKSDSNVQSYIDNVLIPMVNRYEDNPYLLGWEICNEPEWMFETQENGPQSFSDVQKLHARFAAAIHNNSSKFVTTGSAGPKWNSPVYDYLGPYEGNMFSDEALSSSINDANAYLDFYQYHWYPWQTQYMGSPFTMSTQEYQVDDKPVIVGESEGNAVCDAFLCQTVPQMYENAFRNGFDGVCAWKIPQNDGLGTFENIAVATNLFHQNHPNLVYPLDEGGSDPDPIPAPNAPQQAYPNGVSHLLPGTIEAVDFDIGGSGVAYYDVDDGNRGDGPRAYTSVDTEYRTSGGSIGWIAKGEWLEYTVDVSQAGIYSLALVASTPEAFCKTHIEVDGVNSTGVKSIQPSGSWGDFIEVAIASFNMSAGEHVVRLFVDEGGFNLSQIIFTRLGDGGNGGNGNGGGNPDPDPNASQDAYPDGVPHNLPGEIKAVNFDKGGAGIAYYDVDSGNKGNGPRADTHVDTELRTAEGTVGWIGDGEWLAYTVDVQDSGRYSAFVNAATTESIGRVHFESNNNLLTGITFVPPTGGWGQFNEFEVTDIQLNAGEQVIKFVADTGSFNLEGLRFVLVDQTGSSPDQSAYPSGVPHAIPGQIQSVNFDNGGAGIAYNDVDTGNKGDGPRGDTDVDTEYRTNAGTVSWIATGEWLEYTVNVANTANYNIAVQVATTENVGRFHIEFDGNDMTGSQKVNSTGGWGELNELVIFNVPLDAGVQTMRIAIDGGAFNLAAVTFTQN